MADTPIEESQQAEEEQQPQSSEQVLEGGAYEIIQKRLLNLSNDLFERISLRVKKSTSTPIQQPRKKSAGKIIMSRILQIP